MKVLRATLSAPVGMIRSPESLGNFAESSAFPFFSTIQGILSRAAGETVYFDGIDFNSYRFSYDDNVVQNGDIMTAYKLKGKKYQIDLVYYAFLTNPRIDIYLPLKWKEKLEKPRYPLYFGSPSWPASWKVEEVELVKLEDWNKDYNARGAILRRLEPYSIIMNAAYEFEYDPNDIKKRKIRHSGKHIFIPYSTMLRGRRNRIEVKRNEEWAYVDSETGGLVVIFDAHPAKIYGGDVE